MTMIIMRVVVCTLCNPSVDLSAQNIPSIRVPSFRPPRYCTAMHVPLTQSECQLIDSVVRAQKRQASDALAVINTARKRHGVLATTLSTVSRYCKGDTHRRDKPVETRGRPPALTRAQIRAANLARLRLVKKADNEVRVTWAMVIEEAGLGDAGCHRTLCDTLRRELGVAYRPARKKIGIVEEDAKKRLQVATQWKRKPARFWTQEVHGYVDNKAFVLPLTPKQRKRFRQTRVTGHLRTKAEGLRRGYTQPRQKHSWQGFPSVTVTAMVARDKVIMWHYQDKTWNGQTAAETYEGPMLSALKRVWGERSVYRVVEDGDRKGNQSKKGIAAKRRAHIRALTLPPRTPELMPLDAKLWHQIENRMDATAPAGTEAKATFLKRLRRTALTLPKAVVRKALEQTPTILGEIIAAGGYHPKSD